MLAPLTCGTVAPMRMTVTLTLDVDAERWMNLKFGGDIPADELRGHIALQVADEVDERFRRVVSVTDTPVDEVPA